jgi:pimeloyl-ACP methyl ester carboxylesterase
MSSSRESTLSVNGIDLHYRIDGAGEPLLLLHGMMGCAADWVYAGRDEFLREYMLIAPDARGHGRSTNPQKVIKHRQCALDFLALLDHLGVERCRAIGMSFGGNTLLHMATQQPDRIEAMVLVSATMYFPEQARKIMQQVPIEKQPHSEWESNSPGSPRRHSSSSVTATRCIRSKWLWTCIAPYPAPLSV